MNNSSSIKLLLPNKKTINLHLDGNESELLDLLSTLSEIPSERIKGIKDNFDNYYTVSSIIKNKNNLITNENVYYELIYRKENEINRQYLESRHHKESDDLNDSNVSISKRKYKKRKKSKYKKYGDVNEEYYGTNTKEKPKRKSDIFNPKMRPNHMRTKTFMANQNIIIDEPLHNYLNNPENKVYVKKNSFQSKLSSSKNMDSYKIYSNLKRFNNGSYIPFSSSSSEEEKNYNESKSKSKKKKNKKKELYDKKKNKENSGTESKSYIDISDETGKARKVAKDKYGAHFKRTQSKSKKKNQNKKNLISHISEESENIYTNSPSENEKLGEMQYKKKKSAKKYVKKVIDDNPNHNFYINLYQGLSPVYGSPAKEKESEKDNNYIIGRQGSIQFYKKFFKKFGKKNILSDKLYDNINYALTGPEGEKIITECDKFLEGENTRDELISFLNKYQVKIDDSNKKLKNKKSKEKKNKYLKEKSIKEIDKIIENLDKGNGTDEYYKEYEKLRKSINDKLENYFSEEDLKLVKQMFKYENKDLMEELKAYKTHRKVGEFISGIIKILNNFKFKKKEGIKLENLQEKKYENSDLVDLMSFHSSNEDTPNNSITNYNKVSEISIRESTEKENDNNQLKKKDTEENNINETDLHETEKSRQLRKKSNIPLNSISKVVNPIPFEQFNRNKKKKKTEFTDLKKKMIYKKLSKKYPVNLYISTSQDNKKHESEHNLNKSVKIFRKTNRTINKENLDYEKDYDNFNDSNYNKNTNIEKEKYIDFSDDDSLIDVVEEKKIKFNELNGEDEPKEKAKNQHKGSILKNKDSLTKSTAKKTVNYPNNEKTVNKKKLKFNDNEKKTEKRKNERLVSVKESRIKGGLLQNGNNYNYNRSPDFIIKNKNTKIGTIINNFGTKVEPRNLHIILNNKKANGYVSRNSNPKIKEKHLKNIQTEEPNEIKIKSITKKKNYQSHNRLPFESNNCKNPNPNIINKPYKRKDLNNNNNKNNKNNNFMIDFNINNMKVNINSKSYFGKNINNKNLFGDSSSNIIQVDRRKKNQNIVNSIKFNNLNEYFDYLINIKAYDTPYIEFIKSSYKLNPKIFDKYFIEYKSTKNESILRQHIQNFGEKYILKKNKDMIKILIENDHLDNKTASEVIKLMDNKNERVNHAMDEFLKTKDKDNLIKELKKIVKEHKKAQ